MAAKELRGAMQKKLQDERVRLALEGRGGDLRYGPKDVDLSTRPIHSLATVYSGLEKVPRGGRGYVNALRESSIFRRVPSGVLTFGYILRIRS